MNFAIWVLSRDSLIFILGKTIAILKLVLFVICFTVLSSPRWLRLDLFRLLSRRAGYWRNRMSGPGEDRKFRPQLVGGQLWREKGLHLSDRWIHSFFHSSSHQSVISQWSASQALYIVIKVLLWLYVLISWVWVCFIIKSFLTYSFFSSPTPALSTISRPLSSSMCSITPETANVGGSYNRMRGPGIGCWFSDRSNCSHWSLTLTFTLTSENLSVYTTLLLLLVLIQLSWLQLLSYKV